MHALKCWKNTGMTALSLFTSLLCAGALATGQPSALDEASSIDAVAEAFLPSAAWQAQDTDQLQSAIRQMLGDNSTESVFHPDADSGPLSKALLAVIIEESTLPHTRYRLRYARASIRPQAQPPVPVELVEVIRFNLGPALRQTLVAEHGENRVAPAADFGDSGTVAWRFVTRPVMGQVADITHAARRTLTAEGQSCFSTPCDTLEPLIEQARQWPEPAPLALTTPHTLPLEILLLETGLEQLGLAVAERRGFSWQIPEWPESVPAGTPFVEVIIERGLGQDDSIDLAIHFDQLMDHETKGLWHRLMAISQGEGHPPLAWETGDRELWPRE